MGNVLVLGSGGREHAFCRALRQDPAVEHVHVLPGNAGMRHDGFTCHPGVPEDPECVAATIEANGINLLIVGPEAPLVSGLVDALRQDARTQYLAIVGPGAVGAQLEGSKQWAKAFMVRHGIPTASYNAFTNEQQEQAEHYLDTLQPPYVLKADGLAGGKGVLICQTRHEATAELKDLFAGKFGQASRTVVIEEFLEGVELSVFALIDGENYVLLPEAKDYKRIGNGDTGLNTGGMGSVSPVPFATQALWNRIEERIVRRALEGLKAENIDYKGILFIGLMCNPQGNPYVVEFNVRMGDPEAQVVLPRIDESLYALLLATARGTLSQSRHAKAIENAHCLSVTLTSHGYPNHPRHGDTISIGEIPSNSWIIYSGIRYGVDQFETAGGRVISACAMSPTLLEAKQDAYRTAEAIAYTGKYARTDIGDDLLEA